MTRILSATIILLFMLTACNTELPTACFDIDYTIIQVEDEIELTNCSDNADTYFWDFGNDSTTTTESPTVKYHETGIYTISLTAFKDKKQNIAFYEITVIN